MGKKTSEMDVAEKVVVMSQVIGEGIDCLSGYIQHTWVNPVQHENVLRCISKFGEAMRILLEVEEESDFDSIVKLVEEGCKSSSTQVTLGRVKAIIDGTYEVPEVKLTPKQLKENGMTTLLFVHDTITDHLIRVALSESAFERDIEGLRILRVCIRAYEDNNVFLVTKCLADLDELISSEAKLSILMGLPQEEGGNK